MQKRQRGFVHILLTVFLMMLILGGLGYFAFKDGQIKVPGSGVPIISPAPTINPTLNWKTYTDPSGYSFKYPDNLEIETLNNQTILRIDPPDVRTVENICPSYISFSQVNTESKTGVSENKYSCVYKSFIKEDKLFIESQYPKSYRETVDQILSTLKFIEAKKTLTLPVKMLNTGYGIDMPYVYEYQKEIQIPVSEKYINRVDAYGAAEKITIGPKGLTGEGHISADGSTLIRLYDPGKTETATVLIEIHPACVGCIWGSAAPYFPGAENRLTEEMKVQAPEKINGLVVTKISDKLVRYSVKDNSGNAQKSGVAYYLDADQPFFTREEIDLNFIDQDFADELLGIFVFQYNLDRK